MNEKSYWEDVHHHTDIDRFWMNHPRIRAYINTCVSGTPEGWPMDWFADTIKEKLPLPRVVSIGCGVGNLERDLARRGIAKEIVGIDSAEAPIGEARTLAESEGLAGLIRYEVADARAYINQCADLDAIFFHASLHHFDDLDELLSACRLALHDEGLLYLDEFVGPSVGDWSFRRLLVPNLLYYSLPQRIRRTRFIRTPRNPHDPTEAIRAGEIIPTVRRYFDILHQKDYGGNLLSLIYPNLLLPSDSVSADYDDELLDAAVSFLIDVETTILRHPAITRSQPFHAVVVAKPKTTPRVNS